MRPSSSSPQWLCGDMPAMDSQWQSSRIVSVRTNRALGKERIYGTTLIMGDSTVSGLLEKKMSQNRKCPKTVKIRFFPGAKIKDMFHYAIPLLEKKPNYVILHVGTNDTPYKAGSGISNEILELMRFIKEKYPGCKKITLPASIIRTDNYNDNKKMKALLVA